MIKRRYHTKGPWNAVKTDDGHEIRMATSLNSRDEFEVQHLIEYYHGLDMSGDVKQYHEALSNARLIAAAPDLWDALCFCASVIKRDGLFDMSEKMAYKKAMSALALAENGRGSENERT